MMMSNELVANEVSAGAKPRANIEAANIEAAGMTNVGLERSANEDAYLIATLQRSMVVHDASPEAARGWVAGGSAGTLLMVADGMGGQGGGHVASKIAVNTVAGYLLNVMPWATASASNAAAQHASLPGVRDGLSSALVIGDSTVKTEALQTTTPHMGTTLTMALVLWPVLYVAHVGDTRCYLLRAGKLYRLTTDHTMAQMMIAEGGAAPIGPTSELHHILWNCLGGSEQLPKPEVTKLALELGDVLLLCSDGLTKHVGDEQLAMLLSAAEPSAICCAKLVERAIVAGGSDNVTVVIAKARSAPDLRATRAQ